MSDTASSAYCCIAKSQDGGQRFYEFKQNEYHPIQDHVAFENSCVKINTIPSGCPVTDAWAISASDSREVAAYLRSHGSHSHYNGLKPRWLLVNLRARDVWCNFSVNRDLMLENVISLRGQENDECFAIVDRSIGGPFVDYNLFPMRRNVTSGIMSNWSWWKSIEFIMRVWLLAQKDDAVVVYQVLLDYSDPHFPDRPTNFTYAIRFVAQDNELKTFLTTCFDNIVNDSSEQPANMQQFYSYAMERQYLSKTLQRVKRITGERLQLEDIVKDGIVVKSTSLSDGSRASVKEQIQVKWQALRSIADEIQDKAADKVAKFSVPSLPTKPTTLKSNNCCPKYDSSSDDSDDDTASTCSVQSTQSSQSTASGVSKIKLVVKGFQVDKSKPLKKDVAGFFEEFLGLRLNLLAAYQLALDQQGKPIICVQLESDDDRDKLMRKRHVARSLGAELQMFGQQGRKQQQQVRWANNASVVYPRRDQPSKKPANGGNK